MRFADIGVLPQAALRSICQSMAIIRKIAIVFVVLLVVGGIALYFLSRGTPAELSVDEVAGTDPTLAEPSSESFPTVQIAKPVGWEDGDLPEAAEGLNAVSYTHLTLPTNREV